jgi:ketosteroid isomerase-like protein
MYHLIVRRRTVAIFERLSRGEWRSVVERLSEQVHHIFPGTHPLGGERHTRAAVLCWFERLDRLFPGHTFQVHRVASRGWPWSTWVAVQWSAQLRPQVGEPYVNHGAHWIHIGWGKVKTFHAYLDTQRIVEACDEMARRSVNEAAAAPILDATASSPVSPRAR